MPRITHATIEAIKDRLPVSEVVGGYVQLKRAGREWRALSPFARERTPSFFVNDQKGFWHCLAGDTRVMTRAGVRSIRDLATANCMHEVLTTGGIWKWAPFKSYGVQPVYEIVFQRNGVRKTVRATSGHRWFRQAGEGRAKTQELTTLELRPGHRMVTLKPKTRDPRTYPSPFGVAHGFVFGDGYIDRRGSRAQLCGPKDEALRPFFLGAREYQREGRTIIAGLPSAWKELPSFRESVSYLYGFLAGLFAADGCVSQHGTAILNSARAHVLEEVRKLCDALGVMTHGIVTQRRTSNYGGSGEMHRIALCPTTLEPAFFVLPQHRERFEQRSARGAQARTGWTVVSVSGPMEPEEVFCAEVPDTHCFALEDHLLTGNCFSTGKHGNAIDFVMEMSGLTFPEAVEDLAGRAGIEVTRDGITRETESSRAARGSAIELLACAQDFFVRQLQASEAAQAYLRKRGLRRRIASQLGIGWAPEGGRALLEHLADQGWSTQDAIEAGVATSPEDPSVPVRDFYRGRIMFPIRNRLKEVISFGGRAMDGGMPKYLNGRETALFDKGRVLYHMDRARQAISRNGCGIVLEGYMDVAQVAQAGIENVVAPMGTALTVEHLHALWRVAPVIVHIADGDEAGARAADRTLDTALPWVSGDRRIVFGVLPRGVDPDDLVRSAGPNALQSVIRQAQHMAERLWLKLRAETPGDGPEDRAKLETEIRATLAVVGEETMRRAFTDELLRRTRRLGQARPQLGPTALERRLRPAIPAREAALVVAVLDHPEYLDASIERFCALKFAAPAAQTLQERLVRAAGTGTAPDLGEDARLVGVLRQALPQPLPSFVSRYDLDGFEAACNMAGTQLHGRVRQ